METLNLPALKRRSSLFALAFIGLSTLPLISATAQNKWSFTIRPAANFSTKKLGSAKLKTGFGTNAILSYNFTDWLGIYGLRIKSTLAGSDVSLNVLILLAITIIPTMLHAVI
jgi:hypothetical protein